MRVHLRLTEKDTDLCKWRCSVKKRMITYYIGQILLSEKRGEIAYIPTALRMTANTEPCEVYMNFTNAEIVEYLSAFPLNKRNETLKRIICKHLQAQSRQMEKGVVYQDTTEVKPLRVSLQKIPEKKRPTADKPANIEPKKEIHESEEDRAAVLALIEMCRE